MSHKIQPRVNCGTCGLPMAGTEHGPRPVLPTPGGVLGDGRQVCQSCALDHIRAVARRLLADADPAAA